MAEPFVGEIRIFSFGVIPRGWLPCNGQLLQIRNNTALFSLLGTTYGGDGRTDFALPDLRGRAALHPGASFALGNAGGEQTHALTVNEMPTHNHLLNVSSAGATNKAAAGNYPASSGTSNAYAAAGPTAQMASQTLSVTGAAIGHSNMQPYSTFNYCIATMGLYPTRP